MNGSLDTNVILRVLLTDEPQQHALARALIESGQFHVSDAAVIEVVFVLGRHYKLSRDEQHAVLSGFLAQPNVLCNYALLMQSFDLSLACSVLSFEDCYLVTLAEQVDAAPLFTFDRALGKQPFARLVG